MVILPPMPLSPAPIKRTVAALLPLSIMWVFAACVLICGMEHAAAHGEPHPAPAFEVKETADTPASEGCPDASLLKAASASRVTLRTELQAASGLVAAPSMKTSSAAVTRVSARRRPFQPDPPLDLLPALRI